MLSARHVNQHGPDILGVEHHEQGLEFIGHQSLPAVMSEGRVAQAAE